MKKNRLRCTLYLTILTILMLLTMSVSAQAAGVKTPGKVTVSHVRLAGSSNVTVYWKKTKNATNYRIYYKQAGAKSWKGIATVGAGRTSYTHNSSSKNPLVSGTAQQLCSPETPNLHLISGTEYESDYYVSDWKHMIAYIRTSYEPGMYYEHRVEIYNQLQTGTFPISVYYKNTLLRTCQVSVITTNKNAVKDRQWIDTIERNAWTDDMSVMEKLKAIEQYVYDNYTYTTDSVKCNAGARALLYAARDLGLTARYRFVGPQYDYEKGFGDVYYHFGSAFCGGHVCTIITIDGKEYIMETQGHEG